MMHGVQAATSIGKSNKNHHLWGNGQPVRMTKENDVGEQKNVYHTTAAKNKQTNKQKQKTKTKLKNPQKQNKTKQN